MTEIAKMYSAKGKEQLPQCIPTLMDDGFLMRLYSNLSGPDLMLNDSQFDFKSLMINDDYLSSYETEMEGPLQMGHGYDKQQWYEVVIPVICICGVIGNLLNLVVLTRRRLLSRMDDLEKSATYGLIALAISDIIFCITVLPHSFIMEHKEVSSTAEAYHLYYKLYGVALINLFLMISTWLIVYMAINRYIVVVYPFQARWTLGTKKTIFSILLVYLISTTFTMPFFIHMKIQKCVTRESIIMYEIIIPWSAKVEKSMTMYIRWIWPVLAVFTPLVLLGLLNIGLIRELRRASQQRQMTCRGQTGRESSQRVTLTLVIIVLMLLFLVSPSEILRYVNPYKNMGKAGHMISAVTNVFQTVNFALNFALYCVVSESFRLTVKSLFSCCVKKKDDAMEMQSMLTSVNSTKKKMSDSVIDARYHPYA